MFSVSKISANCLSCALRNNFRFSAFISCPCLSLECERGPENHKTKISYPFGQMIVSILLISVIAGEAFYCAYWSKIHYSQKKDVVVTMTYFLNFLYYFRAAFSMMINTIKVKTAYETLEKLGTLLETYRVLQNQIILSRSVVKDMASNALNQSLGIIAVTMLYAVIVSTTLLGENWNVIQTLVSILAFYVDNRIVMFMVSKTRLYQAVITQYQIFLIKHLEERLKLIRRTVYPNSFVESSADLEDDFEQLLKVTKENRQNEIKRNVYFNSHSTTVEYPAGSEDDSLVILIKQTTKHYFKLSNNLLRWNNFYNPTFVIWSLIGTCMICISIFAIYVSILRNNRKALSFEFIELQIRIYVSIIFMIYGLMEIGSIDDLKENLFEYVNRYPATTLTTCESEQLEILVTCFIKQNVVIRASDIFNIRREWLASIVGVMVTYALVVIQFESAWA